MRSLLSPTLVYFVLNLLNSPLSFCEAKVWAADLEGSDVPFEILASLLAALVGEHFEGKVELGSCWEVAAGFDPLRIEDTAVDFLGHS